MFFSNADHNDHTWKLFDARTVSSCQISMQRLASGSGEKECP